jgi:phosphotransferase system enzyme I (PtsI)
VSFTIDQDSERTLRFSGISASRGIAIGPAYRYHRTLLKGEDHVIAPNEVAHQLERFEAAVHRARKEIEKVRRVAEQKVGTPASSIFEAQMMMVSDEYILESIRRRIKLELKPAAFAVDTELSNQQALLVKGENVMMRERADDVEDIKQRLLRYLLDRAKWRSKIDRPSIVIAAFLTPADAILFTRSEDRTGSVLGYAIDGGGVTSHVAILARSLGLPAIVALHNASEQINTGDMVILDGERGELLINPDQETLRGYQEERSMFALGASEARIETIDPIISGARTRDGKPVTISMNLEFGSEVAIEEAERTSRLGSANLDAKPTPALGLGLVRTEHFLLQNEELPTEEEQNTLYADLAKRFAPAKITLRTFDVGGDKVLAGSYREDNPFLGWRGLRISLDEPEIFLAQLRAILRASCHGSVRVMFPMVTNVDELRRALKYLEEAKTQLTSLGEDFDDNIEVGIMVEVPAAAMLAHAFAPLIDFFSIGTNDLTQYTLAVDRGNDLIATMYQELHPAVLRLIQMTVKAAHDAGKKASVCGELGSYPLATPVLVGLGVDEFSVAPSHVRSLAARIHSLNSEEAVTLADQIITKAHSPNDVKQAILAFLGEHKLMTSYSEAIVGPSTFGRKLIKR